jgi:hypothetical protein
MMPRPRRGNSWWLGKRAASCPVVRNGCNQVGQTAEKPGDVPRSAEVNHQCVQTSLRLRWSCFWRSLCPPRGWRPSSRRGRDRIFSGWQSRCSLRLPPRPSLRREVLRRWIEGFRPAWHGPAPLRRPSRGGCRICGE